MMAAVSDTSHNSPTLSIPISIFHTTIRELARHLEQSDLYAQRVQHDNRKLQLKIKELSEQIKEMCTSQTLQEQELQRQSDLIYALENVQTKPSPFLSEQISHIPTEDAQQRKSSLNTQPTCRSTLEPTSGTYDYEELMALVNYGDEFGSSEGRKRATEDLMDEDGKQAIMIDADH